MQQQGIHRLYRFHAATYMWHHLQREVVLALCVVLFVFASSASASDMRLQDRSLYTKSTEPGATTSYTVSMRYMSPEPVGSVEMLFCIDPIPYHECVAPTGLDVSNAQLADQQGETGFSVLSKSPNHIILTRLPGVPTATGPSSYTFDGIVNPTDSAQSFSIRLRTHQSLGATGPQVDFGSVKGQMTTSVSIQTQVPPMLIFCVAEQVEENCTQTNDINYNDMGVLNPQTTLQARSQMAVGTNASGGFAITTNGTPMSAGTNVITALSTPTESKQGSNQFGINLVENNQPIVGSNPEGTWANAIASPDYATPNRYKYAPGDVIAYSPNVSLMKKFTVSYIVNSSPSLRAGVYTTTITYIASGRF